MHINRNMRKKDCIASLNEIIEFLQENECFETIGVALNLQEEELDIILKSYITDIDNDECD